MKGFVVHHGDAALQDLGGGTTRRVLAHGPELMAVEVGFETGSEGAVHTHPHVQCSYVRSARFRFCVDGEYVEVSPGDTLSFPPDVPHGTRCLEAGTLLDIFTPEREDFLKK